MLPQLFKRFTVLQTHPASRLMNWVVWDLHVLNKMLLFVILLEASRTFVPVNKCVKNPSIIWSQVNILHKQQTKSTSQQYPSLVNINLYSLSRHVTCSNLRHYNTRHEKTEDWIVFWIVSTQGSTAMQEKRIKGSIWPPISHFSAKYNQTTGTSFSIFN